MTIGPTVPLATRTNRDFAPLGGPRSHEKLKVARMSFGYVMNRLGGGVGLNERGQALVDAAYQAAGFRTSQPGFWVP